MGGVLLYHAQSEEHTGQWDEKKIDHPWLDRQSAARHNRQTTV